MGELNNENIEKALTDLEEIAKGSDSEEVKDDTKKDNNDDNGKVKKAKEDGKVTAKADDKDGEKTDIEKAIESSPLIKGFTDTVTSSISELTDTVKKGHDNQKKFNEKAIEVVKDLKDEVVLMKGQIDEFGDQESDGQKSKTEVNERSFSKGHDDEEDDGTEISKAEVQSELDDMVKANEADVITATSFELHGVLSPELQGKIQERIMNKAHNSKKLKITG